MSATKVSRPITGFHGGVSQQSSYVRLDNQHEEIENCLCGVVNGLEKRVGTKIRKDITGIFSGVTDLRGFYFDAQGKTYHGFLTNNPAKPLIVLDDTGAERAVVLDQYVMDYLNSGSNLDSIKVCPVNDTLLITNQEVTCRMTEDKSSHDYVSLTAGEQETMEADYQSPRTMPLTQISESYTCTTGVTRVHASVQTYCRRQMAMRNSRNDSISGWLNQSLNMPVMARVVGINTADASTVNGAWVESTSNGTWVNLYPNLEITQGIKSFKIEFAYFDSPSDPRMTDGEDFKMELKARPLQYTDSTGAITAINGQKVGNSYYTNGTIQTIGTVAELPTKGEMEDIWKTLQSGSEIVYKIDAQQNSYVSSPFYLRAESQSYHFTESIAPSIEYKIDPATMPVKIIPEGTGFKSSLIEWGDRKVGDAESNPTPSFIGKSIMDLKFFKNRLWMILNDGMVGSKALDFYNFWATSTTTVLDDDPLDVPLNSTKTGQLLYAGVYAAKLLLFGEHEQYSFYSGDEALTPKTAVLSSTLSFDVAPRSNILNIGSSMYFIEPMEENLNLREMMIQPDILVEDAANLNLHVPTYIPYQEGDRTRLIGTAASDIVFLHTESDPKALYVYQYKWEGDQKAQSAWHRWVFKTTVEDIYIRNHTLYMVMNNGGTRTLESITLDESFKFNSIDVAMMDRRVLVSGGSYNQLTDKTTFNLPFTDTVNSDYIAVDIQSGFRLQGSIVNGNTFVADRNQSAKTIVAGIPYNSKVHISRFAPKPSNGVPFVDDKSMVEELVFIFTRTGFFRLRAVHTDGREIIQDFTASTIGRSSLGKAELHDGIFGIKPNLRVQDVEIYLENKSHLPMEIVMGEYRGTYQGDYQRT